MFEILKQEATYSGVCNTSAAVRGSICYKAGLNAAGDTLLDLAKTSANSLFAVYPVNKIVMREDLADTDDIVNKFAKGERCIWYEGGTFHTDQYVHIGSRGTYAGTSYPTGYPTDTAGYSLHAGALVPLFVTTATGQYGKLQPTSRGINLQATGTSAGTIWRKNWNFDFVKVYNATPSAGVYTSGATVVYKVKPSRIGIESITR